MSNGRADDFSKPATMVPRSWWPISIAGRADPVFQASASDQCTFDLGDLTQQVLMSLRPSLRKHNLKLDDECHPWIICRQM
jgi:hypothetical protein